MICLLCTFYFRSIGIRLREFGAKIVVLLVTSQRRCSRPTLPIFINWLPAEDCFHRRVNFRCCVHVICSENWPAKGHAAQDQAVGNGIKKLDGITKFLVIETILERKFALCFFVTANIFWLSWSFFLLFETDFRLMLSYVNFVGLEHHRESARWRKLLANLTILNPISLRNHIRSIRVISKSFGNVIHLTHWDLVCISMKWYSS